ncbi:PREDICTED: proline-rich protein 4-like isoform X1 [Lupinus angustifolius]|uniref:proline-rich protein 4-like isoform X1 n=1 Tax=Lupinus angustifolius TaxID=3871 RepID=UPI00092FABED|nr:PREDICTED: proline-rich protein 4-like isoform X1 [Lupinus angustifolius]
MKILTQQVAALVCFWLSLFFVLLDFCHAEHSTTVKVVGLGECTDCKEYNIKTSQAFSGLRVTVECKTANEHFKTRGDGELDKNGNFRVSLPNEIVKDGEMKEECYAQLHSASAAPCSAHHGLDQSKIIIDSKDGDKHTLTTAGKLKFASLTCTSSFFWPFFKHPLLHKLPHLPHFSFPPKVFPPFPPKFLHKHPLLPPKVFPPFPPTFFPKHPLLPPPVPVYEKPLPPPVPVHVKPIPPPAPIYHKPLPPPVPTYHKPLPPPVPVYEKPLPPPVPIYHKPIPPPTPTYKKPLPPPVPIYHKPIPPPVPIYHKPIPPPTPTYKKPLPPPVPIYHKPIPPPVPIYHKPIPPPTPTYKKPLPPPIPIFKKPYPPKFIHPLLPPKFKHPLIPHVPIYKPPFFKPLPPFPKLPPFKKLPFPKSFFHHPKFGKWPPLPPFSPHP